MRSRQVMTQRAAISRRAAGTDAHGHPSGDYGPHLSGVPCGMYVRQAREAVGNEKVTTIVGRRIIFPLDTDITTADAVDQVTDRRGRVVFTGPMRIDTIVRRPDHLECELVEVT